jgi:TolB-like protein
MVRKDGFTRGIYSSTEKGGAMDPVPKDMTCRIHLTRYLFFSMLLCVFFATSEAGAKQKITVAVLEIRFEEELDLTNSQANYFTDLIRQAAVRVLPRSDYRVMDRESLDVVLTKEAKAEIVKNDNASDIRVGKIIGADFLATGEVFKFKDQFRINLKLFQTSTAEVIDQRLVRCGNLLDVEDKLPKESEILFRYILRRKPVAKKSARDAFDPYSGSTRGEVKPIPSGDRFHATDEQGEIIFDAESGLEWRVGPDKDTKYDQAVDWVQSLNENDHGWRLPTSRELAAIYQPGLGDRNMPASYKTTGWIVWTDEVKGSIKSGCFNFFKGRKGYRTRKIGSRCRVFAVRARY